jgi:hypothetical protein
LEEVLEVLVGGEQERTGKQEVQEVVEAVVVQHLHRQQQE